MGWINHRKIGWLGLLIGAGFLLVIASQAFAQTDGIPTRGAAPEVESLNWINSDAPQRIAALRGSVILLEFWTFDCINCIHTLPHVEQWYQRYRDQGLVVLGIHYPEFSYEHDLQNVYAATQRLDVTYPVGIDNDGATWKAYNQRYWPTIYLIDKQGNIRYLRIGEGNYDATEAAIQALLAEDGVPVSSTEQPAAALAYLTPDVPLNVRAAPDVDSAQIGAINPGMALVILGDHDGWYQISYNDGVGYVSGDYVTVHEG